MYLPTLDNSFINRSNGINILKRYSSLLDLYPKLTSMPVLQNPEVTPSKEVRFPCKIDYPIGQPDVGFTVTWTVDGHELLDPTTKTPVKTVLVGDSRIAYLDAMKLKYNLGKEVKFNFDDKMLFSLFLYLR